MKMNMNALKALELKLAEYSKANGAIAEHKSANTNCLNSCYGGCSGTCSIECGSTCTARCGGTCDRTCGNGCYGTAHR